MPGQGYYSFDVGTWHLIALNSNCGGAGGCGATSPQGKWLRADLAAHTRPCTLAYWHIPLFSSGGRASPELAVVLGRPLRRQADVVLNGHDHIYERFAPQTPTGGAGRGERDPRVHRRHRRRATTPASPPIAAEQRGAQHDDVRRR